MYDDLSACRHCVAYNNYLITQSSGTAAAKSRSGYCDTVFLFFAFYYYCFYSGPSIVDGPKNARLHGAECWRGEQKKKNLTEINSFPRAADGSSREKKKRILTKSYSRARRAGGCDLASAAMSRNKKINYHDFWHWRGWTGFIFFFWNFFFHFDFGFFIRFSREVLDHKSVSHWERLKKKIIIIYYFYYYYVEKEKKNVRETMEKKLIIPKIIIRATPTTTPPF